MEFFEPVTIAFLAGLGSALSACVYPLIPITTSLFGARQVDHWGKGFFLSGVYVAGMSLTYVVLGLIAALGGTVFGAYLGNPWVIASFAVFFFFLGLSFMDIIPLNLGRIGDKFQVEKKDGLLYPLILGIFSGFIAAPCTAPLFGAILLDIAQNSAAGESIIFGVVQAFSFSIGMGLPFLLIGGFAVKLPKPGNWLQAVKFLGGTILLTAGFHYIEDLFAPFPDAHMQTGAAILGLATFAMFFYVSNPLKPRYEQKTKGKIMTASILTIAAFGLFLATSPFAGDGGLMSGNSGEADQSKTTQKVPDELKWFTDYEKAQQAATKSNSIILVDFWATWCQSCKQMEHELFNSFEFKKLVTENNLVLTRLDFTSPDDKQAEFGDRYGIRGLPTIILTDARGNLKDSFIGYKSKQSSLRILSATMKRLKREGY